MMLNYYNKPVAYIMPYTRKAHSGIYPDGLARGIHFAYSYDGKNFTEMNSNYGILFATATISEKNTIQIKALKEPRIFLMPDNRYGIIAVRTNEDGSDDEESMGKVLLFTTGDFIEFKEEGLVDVSCLGKDNNFPCSYADASMQVIKPMSAPFESIPGNMIQVPLSVCDKAVLRYSKLYNTKINVPKTVVASSAEEVDAVMATAVYSDGSTAMKQVDWDTSKIDFKKPGTYSIKGEVLCEKYKFPLANGYGDPVILPWEGKYYFIGTNDNLNDIGIYVREADEVADLFKEDFEQHAILDYDEERGFYQTFWAPEFHVIGGELYILFAVGGKQWSPQCHIMKFKKGGSIIDPASWENPIRIKKMDGSWLGEGGITLDMTYFKAGDKSYVTWSYRQYINSPMDTGSMIYIATIDEAKPWQLNSEPVLLTRPLYGWENTEGTINNEGPYAFVTDEKVYLTYSGGAANGYTYVLGLLTGNVADDLLKVDNWKKNRTGVLSFYSIDGIYGPGHNSFFTDKYGNLMIAYHAEDKIDNHLRCDAIHRVHFNIDGEPVFDLSADRDLDEKLKWVEMEVEVK